MTREPASHGVEGPAVARAVACAPSTPQTVVISTEVGEAGSKAQLSIESKVVRISADKKDIVEIPASAITEVSYGQDVHRRVGTAIGLAVISLGIGALMMFSKSKKHFIGITWADGDKKGGFAVQCDKNEYRGILSALEGISGKKAINSDAMNVKN